MNYQVKCINKTNRTSPHERISHLGGTGWKFAQREVIAKIEAKTDTFYVHVGGHTVDVIVATHEGNKYVKTRNDGIHPDNLLSLPECP
jgi:hypothetical protein